ncbi:hypothetical protein M2323_002599 [Rhodoblastus acidophilus]|uniref:hypothetical protein n=1 Tax=Rhodoblastus acidophilus TaxID=1074 RepID=UPI0022256EFB|nr:hypothetical protein [Rhodoblastus acidophilus]MCW2284712.1 hypothetical protein [Rhodoblastus acidophilus]MCW2333665.1 hypothetical protein [Rhodoblastus acidophilus]
MVRELPPFDIEKIANLRPWTILSTKALAGLWSVDPSLLIVRKYRGVGPQPLPGEWVRGNVTAYMISDVRRWLGDARTDVEMFAEALAPILTAEESACESTVRLFACSEASSTDCIIGARFSATGKKQYLEYIRQQSSL